MTPDTTVKLGDFAFSDTEVPEKIPFGGRQSLAIHDLVGGVRVIDAMGGLDGPMEWSGLFVGPDALTRARQLDTMRRDGAPLNLSWSEFSYLVVIENFTADFERFYQIPYRISCIVAKQNDKDTPLAGKASLDGAIRSDATLAGTLSDSIGNGPLSGTIQSLSSAVKSVSDFAKATQSAINGVLVPLASAQAQVKTLIASVANTAINVTTLGGILPNNPIAQQTSKLMGQVTKFTSLPQLYHLRSVLGRVGTNLHSVGNTGQTISMAGGNLFSAAAQQYGDATAWPLLARANNITDPQVQGLKTLLVPPAPASGEPVGGLLNV